MDDSEKINLAAEALCLIDLSSQNEDQFSGKQTEPESSALSEVLGHEKEVNNSLTDDYVAELPESTDAGKKRRNGRCNLRKSLAWDSAFFSNAGVLDPDELSTIINGAEKDKNHVLPGIEEDVRRSMDSISTLESDNFTVESLEDDLFLDIRASIQRSSKRPPNATNCTTTKSVAMEIDSRAISTMEKESHMEKESPTSQNEVPSKPTLKNAPRQTMRTLKCPPTQNAGIHGSGKTTKQDSSNQQVTKTVTKIDKSSSLRPKPPNTMSRATLTTVSTAKRDSTGSNLVNSGTGSSSTVTGSSKESRVPKVPILTGAKRVLPKPAPSSKSSSLGSSTTSKVPSTRSSTSSDSSDSTLSKTTAKSPIPTARRNPMKNSTVRPAPSSSVPKASSKAGVKNKPPPSIVSANMRSTKISSSVSPASSISEWSSVSSSSSSTIYRTSSSTRNNLDISSSPSVDNTVVPLSTGNESNGTAVSGNNLNKSSTQNATIKPPAKPSGLRMPSPKIGYFDGAKSLVRTPGGTPRAQSGLGNVLSRSGAAISSPRGSSNIKPKIVKVPTARAVSSLANVKSASPKVRSPASSSEQSRASANDSHALTDVEDPRRFSSKTQSDRSGENCLKSQKVDTKGLDENKQVIDTGNGGVKNENLGDSVVDGAFNKHRNIGSGDIKIVQVGDTNGLGSRSIGHTLDKDVLDEQGRLKSFHSTGEDKLSGPNEYENANATDSRAPFALKDSFYNTECPDFSKELAVQPVEKVATSLPTTEQKENI